MVGCSAFGCNSHSRKKETGVTFHRFPFGSPTKLEQWIANMNTLGFAKKEPPFTPTRHQRLCSKHFEDLWFYSTPTGVMKLLNEAIPTIFKDSLNSSNAQLTKKSENEDQISDFLHDPIFEVIHQNAKEDKLMKKANKIRVRNIAEMLKANQAVESESEDEDLEKQINIEEIKTPFSNQIIAHKKESSSFRVKELKQKLEREMFQSALKSKKIKILLQRIRRLQKRKVFLERLVKQLSWAATIDEIC